MNNIEEMKETVRELQKAGAEVTVGLMDEKKDVCSYECGEPNNRMKIYFDWNDGPQAIHAKLDQVKEYLDYAKQIGLVKQKEK